MERSLQSALEKRTRVGAWQSRVYRLERGYLSAWTDVVSAAAHEEPARTDCLFHGSQVAKLTNQADKRFKLDFPWDGAKTLQLRSGNPAMKEAWVNLLRATLEEIEAQIKSTGSVFAYGGTAQHVQDEAYEEAAYLKTNRFLAAYVVDEQSRASYVNDLLNEGFDHMGDRAGGGGDVRRACAGASAAITELIALTTDFKEEMQGLDDLRRGRQTDASASCQLDPTVAAPKIQRFCEEYMSLVGRTIASRLMLELSPFMDTSVAGSSAAPTESTREELVATRRRLDEAYAATDQLVVLGSRAWFMDIRDNFLDCNDLQNASSKPPTPPPEVATQTAAFEPPAAVPLDANPESRAQVAPPDGTARRSSSKALLQVSNAFSAARAATKDGATKMSSGLSVKGRSSGKPATTFGLAGEGSEKSIDPPGHGGGGGMVSAMKGVSVSLPSVFRRGSRTASEKPQSPEPEGQSSLEQPQQQPSSSPKSAFARGDGKSGSSRVAGASSLSPTRAVNAGVVVAAVGKVLKPPDNEEMERSNLFGGSSRSPSTSPRANSSATALSRPGGAGAGGGNATRSREETAEGASSFSSFGATSTAQDDTSRTGALGKSNTTSGSGSEARKGKRAFAGGLWGGGGATQGAGTPAGCSSGPSPVETGSAAALSRPGGAEDREEAFGAPGRGETGDGGSSVTLSGATSAADRDSSRSVATGSSTTASRAASTLPSTTAAEQAPEEKEAKPKPSGGKRRFAGGVFGGPPVQTSSQTTPSPAESSGVDNPFAGSVSSSGGAANADGGRSGATRSSFVAASQSKPAAERSVPGWAASSGAEASVPDWAAEGDGSATKGASSSGGGTSQRSNGLGLAPPSRPEQGEEQAAGKSPFMKVEEQAPARRRPSQRRPGESSSRRAFGGGERLF